MSLTYIIRCDKLYISSQITTKIKKKKVGLNCGGSTSHIAMVKTVNKENSDGYYTHQKMGCHVHIIGDFFQPLENWPLDTFSGVHIAAVIMAINFFNKIE